MRCLSSKCKRVIWYISFIYTPGLMTERCRWMISLPPRSLVTDKGPFMNNQINHWICNLAWTPNRVDKMVDQFLQTNKYDSSLPCTRHKSQQPLIRGALNSCCSFYIYGHYKVEPMLVWKCLRTESITNKLLNTNSPQQYIWRLCSDTSLLWSNIKQ